LFDAQSIPDAIDFWSMHLGHKDSYIAAGIIALFMNLVDTTEIYGECITFARRIGNWQ